jgi:hypothetical protein
MSAKAKISGSVGMHRRSSASEGDAPVPQASGRPTSVARSRGALQSKVARGCAASETSARRDRKVLRGVSVTQRESFAGGGESGRDFVSLLLKTTEGAVP